jgi:hypothetical protein
MPSSENTILRTYDVAEDKDPKSKKLVTLTSKLNRSVNGESNIKNQPT